MNQAVCSVNGDVARQMAHRAGASPTGKELTLEQVRAAIAAWLPLPDDVKVLDAIYDDRSRDWAVLLGGENGSLPRDGCEVALMVKLEPNGQQRFGAFADITGKTPDEKLLASAEAVLQQALAGAAGEPHAQLSTAVRTYAEQLIIFAPLLGRYYAALKQGGLPDHLIAPLLLEVQRLIVPQR